MGFLDKIFGSEPDVDIESRSTLNPVQTRLLGGLEGYLSARPGSHAGTFRPKNTFQHTQPLGPGEWSSLEALEQRALNPQPQSAGQGFLQGALSQQGPQAQTGSMQRFLNEKPADFEQYFQSNVFNPMMEQFQEDILPAISRRAAGTGNYYGSDRLNQDARATDDLLSALTASRSQMAYDSYQQAQNRGLQASQFTSQLETQSQMQNADRQIQAAMAEAGIDQDRASMELQAIVQNLQAQQLPRQVRNEELARQYADFLRKEGARDTHVAQVLSALGLQTQENIATVTPGSQGLLGSFLQGGGASALMGMF